MSKPKDEMFSTNIRMPKHLAHKLNILSESDDRSLNSYMVKFLQDHVASFEEQILDVYGSEEFLSSYESIFGKEYSPYITYNEEEVTFDPEQLKITVKNIMKRGNVRTIKSARMTEALKTINEFINTNKTPTE